MIAAPGSLRLARAALAMALPAGVLLGCEGPDLGFPWDFERMLEQPRDEAFGETAFFPDRRTMRTPPPGTVPRDASGDAGIGAPPPVDRALLERGRDRFGVFCSPCHGPGGHAGTPVAASMRIRRPPSLHSERVRALPVERIRQVIEHGYGMMPGYGKLLGGREAWGVAFYVEALQLAEGVPLETLPPELRRRARAALGAEGAP